MVKSSDQELGDKSGDLFERWDDHLPQHGLSSPLSHILGPVGGNWIEVVRGRRISSKRMLIDPWRTGQVERSWKMGKT
jgi:hypothetical protein